MLAWCKRGYHKYVSAEGKKEPQGCLQAASVWAVYVMKSVFHPALQFIWTLAAQIESVCCSLCFGLMRL